MDAHDRFRHLHRKFRRWLGRHISREAERHLACAASLEQVLETVRHETLLGRQLDPHSIASLRERLAIELMSAAIEDDSKVSRAMKEFSLLGFVAELHAIDRDIEALFGVHGNSPIVEQACRIVEKKAKDAIGREHEEWPDLAESTIADKQRHGFPTPKPLLRTGEMRDSIEHTVHGNEGCVGSNNDKAVWQELGTGRIPPRSFLV